MVQLVCAYQEEREGVTEKEEPEIEVSRIGKAERAGVRVEVPTACEGCKQSGTNNVGHVRHDDLGHVECPRLR